MIASMTGYSLYESDGFTWEIRSVNGRGLEISLHLPKRFSDLEPDLRASMRSRLRRGNVQVWLDIDSSEHGHENEIHFEHLDQLVQMENIVANRYPDLKRPSTFDLLKWPGVLAKHNSRPDQEERDTARKSFERALDEFQFHRHREGQGLVEAIVERLSLIARLVDQIEKHATDQVDLVRQRLDTRLERLNVSVDPARMEQEVALAANRADFSEELDRLSLHLKEFQACLSGSGPHGRRLDFLSQELLREVNTLGAKALIPECASLIVDLKMTVDQIREQVANIE